MGAQRTLLQRLEDQPVTAEDKEPHAAGSDRAKESTKDAKAPPRPPLCLPTLYRCTTVDLAPDGAPPGRRYSRYLLGVLKAWWSGAGMATGMAARTARYPVRTARSRPGQTRPGPAQITMCRDDHTPLRIRSPAPIALRGTRSASCNVLHGAGRRRGGGRMRLQLHLLPCLVRAGVSPRDTARTACTPLQHSATLGRSVAPNDVT